MSVKSQYSSGAEENSHQRPTQPLLFSLPLWSGITPLTFGSGGLWECLRGHSRLFWLPVHSTGFVLALFLIPLYCTFYYLWQPSRGDCLFESLSASIHGYWNSKWRLCGLGELSVSFWVLTCLCAFCWPVLTRSLTGRLSRGCSGSWICSFLARNLAGGWRPVSILHPFYYLQIWSSGWLWTGMPQRLGWSFPGESWRMVKCSLEHITPINCTWLNGDFFGSFRFNLSYHQASKNVKLDPTSSLAQTTVVFLNLSYGLKGWWRLTSRWRSGRPFGQLGCPKNVSFEPKLIPPSKETLIRACHPGVCFPKASYDVWYVGNDHSCPQ